MREGCECSYCKANVNEYFCIKCGHNFNECQSFHEVEWVTLCPSCHPRDDCTYKEHIEKSFAMRHELLKDAQREYNVMHSSDHVRSIPIGEVGDILKSDEDGSLLRWTPMESERKYRLENNLKLSKIIQEIEQEEEFLIDQHGNKWVKDKGEK